MSETQADRLEVRFDPETLRIWPSEVRRRTKTNTLKGATVIHYVERPTKTPTGGRFTSRRFTVAYDGKRWYGQTKNGTDIVRLRLADD